MANFKLGELVKKDKGGTAIVRAIFTTKEGELMYAVERDGALDFIPEADCYRRPVLNWQPKKT